MEINFLALFVAALSTLVIRFFWYHPKVFGTIWMKESSLTEENLKGGNVLMIFGTSLLHAFFISFVMQYLTIHQTGATEMIGRDSLIAKPSYSAFMNDYGTAFRTFKHGALHGFMTGLFFALPIIGTNTLYERRSFKYTFVTGRFWILCLTIMGGIICAWK